MIAGQEQHLEPAEGDEAAAKAWLQACFAPYVDLMLCECCFEGRKKLSSLASVHVLLHSVFNPQSLDIRIAACHVPASSYCFFLAFPLLVWCAVHRLGAMQCSPTLSPWPLVSWQTRRSPRFSSQASTT